MAITEAPPVNPDAPPDVRGPTAPLPATILVLGVAALVVVVAGIVVAALAIAAACGISRHRDARVALSQTAQPPEHAAAVSPEGATAPSAS